MIAFAIVTSLRAITTMTNLCGFPRSLGRVFDLPPIDHARQDGQQIGKLTPHARKRLFDLKAAGQI